MASVKISELPILNQISANNANTVFVAVDKTTNTTSQFATSTLAAGLYANNVLNVGTDIATIYADAIAQFISNTAPSSRVFFQNINSKGTGQIAIATDDGDEANGFINMGIRGSDMDYDAEFDLPNRDGFICMHGKDGEVYGNLWIGTHNSNNDIIFYTGSHTISAEAVRVQDGGNLKLSIPLQFSDSTTQDTAAAPANYTQSAFNAANSAIANTIITQGVDVTQNTRLNSIETVNIDQNTAISIIQGVNLTQNTDITTANNHAWAAFDKANNALANTTGTFGGDLTVAGNTFISGYFNIVNPDFQANSALIDITASDGGAVVPPSNSYYMMHITGKSNNVTRVVFDSFGANTYPLLSGRMGRGSAAAPAAVANNDVLMRIVGNGFTGTQFPASSPTKIDFVASENFSDTNRGTAIQFWNTPIGSNNIQRIATFNANEVSFTGAVNPQKGFIYNPRLPAGNQTSITIDFANDALIKANLVNDLTVTLTNFQYGKIVDLWLINNATGFGSARTITHGCSATNSTVNATSFDMAGTSCAHLRYFSVDGDLANTFVSVEYTAG